MKKGRFSEEQVIGILKQHEAGRKVTDLAPRARHQRSDDLYLEEQIRRAGSERSAALEEPGRGESAIKAFGCRSQSG